MGLPEEQAKLWRFVIGDLPAPWYRCLPAARSLLRKHVPGDSSNDTRHLLDFKVSEQYPCIDLTNIDGRADDQSSWLGFRPDTRPRQDVVALEVA